MNQFDNIQSLITRLKELSTSLSSSKLSESELQEFEDLARSLYERTLILNYKAKEEKVYGKNPTPQEAIKEIETEVEAKTEEVVEAPAKEENVGSPKPSSEIQFDFSNDFETTPKANPVKVQEEVREESKAVATEVEQSPQKDDNQIDELYIHFNKAYKIANSDKLGHAKIHTLKGAFGLNDKLLFIRELFNNDTEEFNKTIELLDSYQSTESVLKKLSEIAVNKNWDKEEVAVNDFVNMVNRRYVE